MSANVGNIEGARRYFLVSPHVFFLYQPPSRPEKCCGSLCLLFIPRPSVLKVRVGMGSILFWYKWRIKEATRWKDWGQSSCQRGTMWSTVSSWPEAALSRSVWHTHTTQITLATQGYRSFQPPLLFLTITLKNSNFVTGSLAWPHCHCCSGSGIVHNPKVSNTVNIIRWDTNRDGQTFWLVSAAMCSTIWQAGWSALVSHDIGIIIGYFKTGL